jgi:predicted peptidase
VCGGGDVLQVDRLRGLPIWVWHGDADRAVPVQQSRLMVAALRAIGSDVQYTELPGVGHDSWRQAYSEGGALQWLWQQRRRP